jgi:hypothetical protein
MRTTIGCDVIDIAPISIVGMVLCVVLLVLLEFEPSWGGAFFVVVEIGSAGVVI